MRASTECLIEEVERLREEVERLKSVEADLLIAEKLRGVFAEISTASAEAGSLESLIRRFRDLLGQLIDTTNFFVALYDEASSVYSIPFYRDECDALESYEEVGALVGSLTDYVRRRGASLFLTPEIEKELQDNGEISGVKGTPAKCWLGSPLRSTAGKVIGVVVVQSFHDAKLYSIRDLQLLELVAGQIAVSVERKRFEEALERSNSFLQTVIEHAPFGIQICEGNEDAARITVMNREAQRIFGISEDMVLKSKTRAIEQQCHLMPWSMLRPDGSEWPAEEIPMRVAMALGSVTPRAEMIVRRSSGEECTVLVSAAPIRDANKKLLGGVSTFSDITDRKRSEEQRLLFERQMLNSQKLESLGLLAGGIAHDFNNLLMVILANSDVMMLESSIGSPIHASLLEIEEAAQKASDLVRELGAYSGQTRFVTEAVSLNLAILKLENMLAISVSTRASLEYDLCDDLPLIEADAAQIQQMIMGIVSNAAEAIGDRAGVIVVRTGEGHYRRSDLMAFIHGVDLEGGRYVFIEVEDNGCGMDNDTLARIFDPFFSTKFVGRGLGMAAVQGIVTMHNGGIRLISEVDKGTVCKLIFPVRDGQHCSAVIDESEIMR